MTVDITIPALGESITEATILRWLKTAGEAVERDEVIVEIETDKATMELVAPETGVLSEILKGEGEKVEIGEAIGRVTPGGTTQAAAPRPSAPATAAPRSAAPQASAAVAPLSPAVRRLVEERAVNPAEVTATGRGGRLTKGDVLQHLEAKAPQESAPAPARPRPVAVPSSAPAPAARPAVSPRTLEETETRERREPMSRIRRRIAERLKQVQNTAAILTTFNEIDMSAVLALRAKYNDTFKERYGISLGFMSLFAKASVEALRAFPAINAEIRGEDIVYKNYYDLGIAVGTEQGLLVPVVREVDKKSLAEIESELADLSQRARAGKIRVEELTGGTFTISNGGVYGSLMSTPILNPPQSGILGMHKIEKRPVVVGPNDDIVVRPMMYVALSYDHRIVDGREAVLFLRRIKDCIEDPARILLGL
ncbi:MAG TPA: 2-oxoglutarate dehydrogenase complex dihydrolipoyllysine-residue succinyltransferase [Candidatus Binatia bacterium]|jgi:2-oxoglutarate dehydrogenase E2 component (dihydrolipoamide succinyltransferase)|nr:2-oxoglutarate dehydrogenase complex dihydrolipoyllysine-residue succinyltransferase [Candidatus Binatia bacterium]